MPGQRDPFADDPQEVAPGSTTQLRIIRSNSSRPPCVVVEIISGPNIGTTFVSDQPITVLCGRGGDCRVRITDDPRVSRHHCELRITPPHARLRDLGSRNGTSVNGTRYQARMAAGAGDGPEAEVDLHHGDRIMVGRTVLEIRVEGGTVFEIREEDG